MSLIQKENAQTVEFHMAYIEYSWFYTIEIS